MDSHCRCAKQRLPGTVSGCTRGRAGKNQKNKKTKKQETKKTKKQKKQKKQDCTPQGEGVRCRVLGLVFLFFFVFFVFLFFCFFGFLVCVWIAIADVPSRDCQALQYSNVCYDIVHSANEQQRGMEFNFVRLRHMLLDLCTGNAAICALPQWPVLFPICSMVLAYLPTFALIITQM